ncbi:methylated-DNA--[protein]-cysteine S-methyltransferase [Methanococcoides burtonii]|uniref:Methylated-DNA--protein-cysteine methyltransferase n=1 Tax=Methanococcoides burtonii (strain DSM 6242 / NBRC 107633 / OCM 468 / ACE-M) TaxID=259564 RepID=Q12TZ2_METBU|nr:methylated-DNA--[protein]-cysteine S-methyltransferase [Methanococcoides burtonii]ABE53084.1 Methylated-DNA--protein-cysteine S-methyltransferase [Methanococcoides burtonii DSM 6242]
MYYDTMQTDLVGEILLVGDTDELKMVALQQGKKRLSISSEWTHDGSLFSNAKEQLQQYFNGDLKDFDLELLPDGTDFQKKVWSALRNIQFGTTVSYSDIAKAIGNPKAVRAVGSAIGANPISTIIPCHRVVSSSGKLTGFSSGIDLKILLLEHEGLKVKGNGKDAIVD